MSLVTTTYLMDKYGVFISTAELAEVLKVSPQTVRNYLSEGKIKLSRCDNGNFLTTDVAAYVDSSARLTPSATA